MTLFHSLPTALTLAASVLLTLLGRGRNSAWAFLGALLASAAGVCALVEGAELREALLYVLVALLCTRTRVRERGRRP